MSRLRVTAKRRTAPPKARIAVAYMASKHSLKSYEFDFIASNVVQVYNFGNNLNLFVYLFVVYIVF